MTHTVAWTLDKRTEKGVLRCTFDSDINEADDAASAWHSTISRMIY